MNIGYKAGPVQKADALLYKTHSESVADLPHWPGMV